MNSGFRFALLLALQFLVTLVAIAQPAAQERALWQPCYITPRTQSQHIALDGEW